MVTTRPCTATCVLDGMPVTLTFYPDTGVLRIADPTGSCIREVRWHASWRALLDEFRRFDEKTATEQVAVDTVAGRLGAHAEPATPYMALA